MEVSINFPDKENLIGLNTPVGSPMKEVPKSRSRTRVIRTPQHETLPSPVRGILDPLINLYGFFDISNKNITII